MGDYQLPQCRLVPLSALTDSGAALKGNLATGGQVMKILQFNACQGLNHCIHLSISACVGCEGRCRVKMMRGVIVSLELSHCLPRVNVEKEQATPLW